MKPPLPPLEDRHRRQQLLEAHIRLGGTVWLRTVAKDPDGPGVNALRMDELMDPARAREEMHVMAYPGRVCIGLVYKLPSDPFATIPSPWRGVARWPPANLAAYGWSKWSFVEVQRESVLQRLHVAMYNALGLPAPAWVMAELRKL